MDLIFGNAHEALGTLTTEQPCATASLDKNERLVVVLGINKLEVFYDGHRGSWVARTTRNVAVEQSQAPERFVAPTAVLAVLHADLHGAAARV